MTIRFKNLQEFADQLRTIQRKNLPAFYVTVLRMVGEETAEDARDRLIGRITPLSGVGLFPAWEPLKPSTIARKEYKGWGKNGNPYSILWATGKLDHSVKYRVEKGKLRVVIGTDVKYAPFLEHGTLRMAPRPFLGPALFRTLENRRHQLHKMFCRVIQGRRI